MDKPLTKSERLDWYRRILEQAERYELPEQVGPEVDVDEIELYAELVERGYLEGHVIRDPHPPINGRAVNVCLPRITVEGREYLEELRRPPKAQGLETPTKYDQTVTRFKNSNPVVIALIVGAVIVALAAFTDAVSKVTTVFKGLVQ
jgi:hypothetical protein